MAPSKQSLGMCFVVFRVGIFDTANTEESSLGMTQNPIAGFGWLDVFQNACQFKYVFLVCTEKRKRSQHREHHEKKVYFILASGRITEQLRS